MQGTIQNRESFLLNVAKRLGREKVNSVCKTPEYKYNPQNSVLQGLTQDQLVEVLKEQCKNIHTTVIMANRQDLPTILSDTVKSLGGGTISVPDDKRFAEMGLDTLMEQEWPNQGIEIQVWDPAKGKENIVYVEKANIGIVISDITLAESGTVTILNDKGKGRNINFLPLNSIMIVPKSTIVPRITQAAKILREKVKNGEKVPSCVNFISGPSNSADIELNLVVGVHGPVRATYIVVDDI
ncbi:lactate utilization protein C [Bacillus sp. DNRA2]|uniref:LutC/YkgG family protein n=1 Tax=Bacillus sp. DNRA2 TaxID=2723053 RepID=UPI00145DDE9D|nr:lactate utilization protein C [Bacillus sp. DNRA2]NMD71416.1 lactate utilization protein C [Bacillus sp. DNRA2]